MGGELFDGYLSRVRADKLKRMVRMWGGRTQMRKAECIEFIRESLRDPERVRAAIAGLKPLEQCALALVKQAGGAIGSESLAAVLFASGWQPRSSGHQRPSHGTLIRKLVQRGLFLTGHSSDPAYLSTSYGRQSLIFSDPRLIEQAGFPQYRPFKIVPDAAPATSVYRRPPVVVLDIMGVLQSIERIGGLGVTKTGKMRVNDLRKLEREISKSADSSQAQGFALPNPAWAWVNAMICSDLVVFDGASWHPRKSLDRFALQPYSEQVRPVLYGFARALDWSEWDALSSYSMRNLPLLRWALIVALAALPAEGTGFYGIDTLGWALFERVGEVLSFDYIPYPPYQGRKTTPEFRQELAVWRGKLRQSWKGREQTWIPRALATWLYQLGLVELGLDERRIPVSIRLTDLGRAVLHPELGSAVTEQPGPPGAVWVIQPNFDVVVYLDRAQPELLAFLERHAEREQAQQHTAHYRLTRNAVYHGLESGTSLDEVLDTLRRGSNQALPQNVEVEIREWAALREKVALYRRARLLEFGDGDARQAALQGGLSGIPIGDRYLQLDVDAQAPSRVVVVDYGRPLPRCIAVAEDGRIRVSSPPPDLAIAAQLDAWAERTGPGEWQLTAFSVAAAVRAKRRIGELLNLLEQRSHERIPPWLRVAVQAWAGKPPVVHMETVTVLKCSTPEVFEAIENSTSLKLYLRGVLAPYLLLIDTVQVDAFLAGLAWAGIEPLGRLPVKGA